MAKCPGCSEQAGIGNDKCGLLIAAYVLAGLAMMLNIRLAYSSAPYALIRFRLPENLFSVFVRRMASALELWCLPSMALGNIIDLFQKLFDGGAELRAIKAEAEELQGKATELKNKSEKQAGTGGDVRAEAGKLASNAGTLSTKATQLASEDKLEELESLATELAKAAKGTGDTDKTSLYAKANELSSATDNASKAIAVIEAFNKVKEAYDQLAKQPTYIANKRKPAESALSQEQRKVQAVDNAWNGVKGDFDILCKALIKQYAEQVDTKAGELQSSPSVDTAGKFKEAYDEFGKIYNAIPDENAKNSVKPHWDALKDVISGEMKRWKFYWIIIPSTIAQWLIFLTYVILLIIFFTVVIGLEKILSQMPNRCSPTIYKIDYPCSRIKIR